jgi:hypothetical protein
MAAPPGIGGILERPGVKWLAASLGLATVIGIAWWLAASDATPRGLAYPLPGERHPYAVEVLNGTDIDGLARQVTRTLRRQGIDVVYFGSAGAPADSTTLLIRRGDSAAARAVRAALGLGRIVAQPDTNLLLDLTVLLGPDAATIERHP